MLFFNLDGHIHGSNKAFERMSGYSGDELRESVQWANLTTPEFRSVTERAAHELATRGETAPYEKQFLRKDGSRWWGLFAPTRLSGSGTDAECVEFVIDISERKRAEAALRKSEAGFRAVTDLVPDLLWSNDAQGITDWYNPRWSEYSGQTP